MIPGPVPVLPRIREAMSKPMIFHRGDEFGTMYGEIVTLLRTVFQTRNDPFVLSGSGTCAMEAAIGNLVDKDTKILCIANGKFGERFADIAGRYTAQVKSLNTTWGGSIDLEAVKDALESNNPDVVTMVHNETSTGILNPAREVGKLVKKHDAVFVLDCVTTIGGDEAPVDDLGADVAIVGSQKCLGAPPGMSAISVSDAAWASIREKQTDQYLLLVISFCRFLIAIHMFFIRCFFNLIFPCFYCYSSAKTVFAASNPLPDAFIAPASSNTSSNACTVFNMSLSVILPIEAILNILPFSSACPPATIIPRLFIPPFSCTSVSAGGIFIAVTVLE